MEAMLLVRQCSETKSEVIEFCPRVRLCTAIMMWFKQQPDCMAVRLRQDTLGEDDSVNSRRVYVYFLPPDDLFRYIALEKCFLNAMALGEKVLRRFALGVSKHGATFWYLQGNQPKASHSRG